MAKQERNWFWHTGVSLAFLAPVVLVLVGLAFLWGPEWFDTRSFICGACVVMWSNFERWVVRRMDGCDHIPTAPF